MAGPVTRLIAWVSSRQAMAGAEKIAAGEGEPSRGPDEAAVMVVQGQERDTA